MGRDRLFTDEEFLQVFKQSKSMQEIVQKLHISHMTAYNHHARLKLPKFGNSTSREVTFRIFEAFKGKVIAKDLARRFRMSIGNLRYHLELAVTERWVNSPDQDERFPIPTTLRQLKIIHELDQDESLYDDPEEISKRTGLTVPFINHYLEKVFTHRSKPPGKRARSKNAA